jgi:hypothetical protein
MRLAGVQKKRAVAKVDARTVFERDYNSVIGDTLWRNLIEVCAQVWDQAITQGNCYITLGSTKEQNAYSLTITIDGERATAYGNTGIEELLTNVIDLLGT